MVEGTYSNGYTGPSANPFGFDSFGNSLAGPGQQSQKPPRSQHPPRTSLVGLLTLFEAYQKDWHRAKIQTPVGNWAGLAVL